mgnify:CR=1 FL=1
MPNFSENLKKYYKDFLEWAKKSLKQAVDYAKSDPIVYEFDFSVVDALKELAEVNFLISEYRVRVLSYRYAKYKELDLTRKVTRKLEARKEQEQTIDDNLLEEEIEREVANTKDEWEE